MNGSRILIVEDEPALLRGLQDTFASKGCEVLTAGDGETGLDLALSRQPDLILLDIMLPKRNGYEICRTVRVHGLDMPIIMLTAKGQEEDIVLGLNLGPTITSPSRSRFANSWRAPTPSCGAVNPDRKPSAASASTSWTSPPTSCSAVAGRST